MRSLRRIAFCSSLGVLSVATAAWALEVRLPNRTTAKASLVVDEAANVLFGATPGKVEVTNLPAVQQVEVTNQAACPEVEAVSFVVNARPGPANTMAVYTVPAGKTLLLSTVDVNFGPDQHSLSDSGGQRLFMVFTGDLPRQYLPGIPFGPGETITITRDGGSAVNFTGAFVGRLVPAS